MAVIRGKPRGNGRQLGHYLLNSKENERIEVIEVRGTASQDVVKACVEINLMSELTKTDKGIYHGIFNPAIGEDNLSRDQWIMAADILEKELGLENKKRVIVLHTKKGRTHAHIAIERYDYQKKKMVSDSHNYKKHDAARHKIEKTLNMRKTPLKNMRSPQLREMMTGFWNSTKTAEGFIKKANEWGIKVVKSDNRRPYMIVDETGRSHDLTRHLNHIRKADVSERFKGYQLPTDRETIAMIRSREEAIKMNKKQDDLSEKLDEFKKKRRPRF